MAYIRAEKVAISVMGLGNSMQTRSKIGTFLAFKHPEYYFITTIAPCFNCTHRCDPKRSNIDRPGAYQTSDVGISAPIFMLLGSEILKFQSWTWVKIPNMSNLVCLEVSLSGGHRSHSGKHNFKQLDDMWPT